MGKVSREREKLGHGKHHLGRTSRKRFATTLRGSSRQARVDVVHPIASRQTPSVGRPVVGAWKSAGRSRGCKDPHGASVRAPSRGAAPQRSQGRQKGAFVFLHRGTPFAVFMQRGAQRSRNAHRRKRHVLLRHPPFLGDLYALLAHPLPPRFHKR